MGTILNTEFHAINSFGNINLHDKAIQRGKTRCKLS